MTGLLKSMVIRGIDTLQGRQSTLLFYLSSKKGSTDDDERVKRRVNPWGCLHQNSVLIWFNIDVAILITSENGSTIKRKEFAPRGANSFLLA